MKTDNFFLDLHNECLQKGKLISNGLCNCIKDFIYYKDIIDKHSAYKIYNEIFGLVNPTEKNFMDLSLNSCSSVYWGYEFPLEEEDSIFDTYDVYDVFNMSPASENHRKRYEYTPLRQNLLLFCHEILNS